jgi:hypothetical protein
MRQSLGLGVALCVFAPLVACADKPVLSPDNELPTGFVDSPKAGEALRPGPTLVSGWAVDDTGVKSVRIYFDRRFAAETTLIVPRPDVSNVLPRYARKDHMHGWNVSIDFGATAGSHTILVQAVDDAGATKEIGIIEVTGPR